MGGTLWTKFYWTDWLSDTGLRRCSIAARGLWIDLLCFMAQHEPIGLLAVKGEALSISDVARMTGISETDATTLLGELERNGVFSRDRNGTIYSRRMVRDAKSSAEARKNGKLGGNPTISKTKEKSKGVNPHLKGGLNGGVKPHIPETISQSSTPRARSLVTGRHRVMAMDLLDRGKAELTPWERKFLEDVCRRSDLSDKAQERLSEIATKIGFNADALMATWRKRMDVARNMRQWDVKWGPMPGKLGCLVPDELLLPSDGSGWTDWVPRQEAYA